MSCLSKNIELARLKQRELMYGRALRLLGRLHTLELPLFQSDEPRYEGATSRRALIRRELVFANQECHMLLQRRRKLDPQHTLF